MTSKQIWLLDLPDACKSGGLKVTTFNGWETRSRSSGGYDDLLGIGYHHDASPPTAKDSNVDNYGWLYADARPVGAMRLHRDGSLVVGAAGATNTMGRGGPLTVSKGVIPKDRGNQTMIAIEAGNNGVGEQWPKVQVDAYVALVGALCKWYGLDPNRDIFGHFDYCAPSCPSRKIDPAGPAAAPYTDLRGANSAGTWKLSAFRSHVKAWSPTPPPTKPPTGETVNWNPTKATVDSIKDAPGVSTTVANQNNDWAMIAMLKAIQKMASLPVTGKYDQATANVVDSKL